MLDSLKVGQRIKFSPKGDVYATKKDGPKHVKLKDPPKEFVGEIVGIFDLPGDRLIRIKVDDGGLCEFQEKCHPITIID